MIIACEKKKGAEAFCMPEHEYVGKVMIVTLPQ